MLDGIKRMYDGDKIGLCVICNVSCGRFTAGPDWGSWTMDICLDCSPMFKKLDTGVWLVQQYQSAIPGLKSVLAELRSFE